MSEEKAVVNWTERLAQNAKDVAATVRPQVSRISLRGGVMTLMEQKIPGNKLQCIILGFIVEHAFYSKPFDPNKPDAPDCFAFGETRDNLVPHEKAFARQHEVCTGCPQNEWGSALNSPSKKGKACKERRKLLLIPSDVLKDVKAVKNAELATLDLPTTSSKFWDNYVSNLSASEGRPSWAVVSSISLEPDARTQIKVGFEFNFAIGDEFLSALEQKMLASKDILFTPYEKTSDGTMAPQTAAMQTGKKY